MLKIFYKLRYLTVTAVLILAITSCADRNPADSENQGSNNSNNQTSFWKKTYGPEQTLSMLVTAQGFFYAGTGNGNIYYSFDTGQSWGHIKIANDEIVAVARHPNGNLFAASRIDVFTSTNNGTIWSSKGVTSTPINSLAIDQVGRIYLGTTDGIYLSTDLGENWTKSGLVNNWVNYIDFSVSGDVFTATSNGVYYSEDNGSSWSLSGLINFWISFIYVETGGILYAGTSGSGIFRSLDGGLSWNQITEGLYNGYVNAILINQQHRIFAGSDGGVYEYFQGTNRWRLIESNPLILQITSLALDSNDFLFAASYSSGIYRSINSTNP